MSLFSNATLWFKSSLTPFRYCFLTNLRTAILEWFILTSPFCASGILRSQLLCSPRIAPLAVSDRAQAFLIRRGHVVCPLGGSRCILIAASSRQRFGERASV